jgi:vacuolar-type H+-ATPase subunit I/STV1
MSHAINLVVSAILTLAGLVMEVIGVIDGFLVMLMTSAGLPPLVQILILVGVALWLVVAAFNVLGRVFALLILILVLLLVVHWLMHGGVGHQLHPMPDLHIPGARQI